MDSASKRTLTVLVVVLVLDLISFACILPLFPALMEFYASEKHADGLYRWCDSLLKSFRRGIGAPDVARFNSVFFGGLLGSLFSFLQFFSSPLLGALSDTYGRKPILIISTLGSLLSYGLWAYADSFSVFLLSRVVGGLSKASVTVATAVISDVCPGATRGKGMAAIGISFSIGFLIGPMIGAGFAKWTRQQEGFETGAHFSAAAAYFTVAMSLLELLVIWLFLPETLPKQKRQQSSDMKRVVGRAFDYVSPKAIFSFTAVEKQLPTKSLSSLRNIGQVYFIYLFLYSGLEFTLTFFTHLRFKYDSIQQGRMYFFTGLLMILVQGGFVRRVSAGKHGRTALCGLVTIVPAYVVVGLAHNQAMLYTGLAMYAFASAVVVPCLTTMVSTEGERGGGDGGDAIAGAVIGVFRSIGAFARALGPLIASALFWLVGPTVCYLVGAVLLLAPCVLLKRHLGAEQIAVAKGKSE